MAPAAKAKTRARKAPGKATRARKAATKAKDVKAISPEITAFDAGKNTRRLRGMTTTTQAINGLIRSYGNTVVARSRYLSANNPYTTAAKEEFVSALIGSGIKPSSLVEDPDQKKAIQLAWFDWSDEADADGITDIYGLQATVAHELFDAGECFVRRRTRRPGDGLTVPLQLQLLPFEMLPLDDNRDLGAGRFVEMGVEFDAIGKRAAYHFRRRHPGAGFTLGGQTANQKVRVPASEVLHIFRPIRAGQVRGIPQTLSSIVTMATLESYEDAELERKRIAALFAAFVTSPGIEDEDHPLEDSITKAAADNVDNAFALEPGMVVDLEPGEDIKFAEPADVGGNYEAFMYRVLLRAAAGYGVPYAAMTGDLKGTSFGSIRAGLITFRRRIEALQKQTIIFQLCKPVWRWFMTAAAIAGVMPFSATRFAAERVALCRAKYIPPRWEWIDPLKDMQAEKLAVEQGFKPRSDVVEADGRDAEENDARIAQDRAREKLLDLTFGESTQPAAVDPDDDDDDPVVPPANKPE